MDDTFLPQKGRVRLTCLKVKFATYFKYWPHVSNPAQSKPNQLMFHRPKFQLIITVWQWCCVTELEVPTSGTSSNFDGPRTELVQLPKRWNLLERNWTQKSNVPVPLYLQKLHALNLITSMRILLNFFTILPYNSYFWGTQLGKILLQPTFCLNYHDKRHKCRTFENSSSFCWNGTITQ